MMRRGSGLDEVVGGLAFVVFLLRVEVLFLSCSSFLSVRVTDPTWYLNLPFSTQTFLSPSR